MYEVEGRGWGVVVVEHAVQAEGLRHLLVDALGVAAEVQILAAGSGLQFRGWLRLARVGVVLGGGTVEVRLGLDDDVGLGGRLSAGFGWGTVFACRAALDWRACARNAYMALAGSSAAASE